jgi:hypothetical protein
LDLLRFTNWKATCSPFDTKTAPAQNRLAVSSQKDTAMKKATGMTLLLSCVLFLGGCMVRMTGPCLGYGCPAMTTGATNARNAAPSAKPSTVTAKNAPAHGSTVHAGN